MRERKARAGVKAGRGPALTMRIAVLLRRVELRGLPGAVAIAMLLVGLELRGGRWSRLALVIPA